MMWRASLARSSAHIIWPGGSGKPSGLTKWTGEARVPWRAYSSSRQSLRPCRPSPSATTTQASLPDWMMMPRIRSSTAMRSPSSTNIFEPCVRQARSETGKVSVSFIRPSFRRWKRSSMVISLVMEAGGIGVKASFCHSTWPVGRPSAARVRRWCRSRPGAGDAPATKARRAETGKGGGTWRLRECGYWSTTIWASLLPGPVIRANAASASATEVNGPCALDRGSARPVEGPKSQVSAQLASSVWALSSLENAPT